MQSMTGFGSAGASDDAGRVTIQIAVVNHRHAQVQVRSDVRDVALENHLRSQVRSALGRGSINVQLAWEPSEALAVDLDGLRLAWQELSALATELGAPAPRLEGVARLQQRGGGQDVALVADLAERALDEAIAQVVAMRRQEGAALQQALGTALDDLRTLRQQMGAQAAGRSERWRDALRERLKELVREQTTIRDEDLIRELALYADRIDVSEELVRIDSHCDQLAGLLASGGQVGKRIEFLLQELGREINTTGSKANDAQLSQLVCAAKSLLEQMREQVANIL